MGNKCGYCISSLIITTYNYEKNNHIYSFSHNHNHLLLMKTQMPIDSASFTAQEVLTIIHLVGAIPDNPQVTEIDNIVSYLEKTNTPSDSVQEQPPE